jgi:hypothetical protein
MHVGEISERYGLLMEAYLRGCGPHLKDLKAQDDFLKKLVSVANHIKTVKVRLIFLRIRISRM